MRDWARFRALDAERRRLVIEAAVLLGFVRLGLRTLSLGRLRRALHSCSRGRRSGSRESLENIGWAVRAAARRFPAPRTCLMEALAADVMLRRRGYNSELHLGVRKTPDRAGPLDGHAWVACGGNVVVGFLETLSDYARLSPCDDPHGRT
jgi:hypothetical protein